MGGESVNERTHAWRAGGPGMGGPGMGRGPGMGGPGMPPPPPPRWGYRGYRRGGCLGCLLPVLLMGALLAAGIAALLLL